MLSRVADNLYWMSRYLERAEHIARLIDVNLQQMLDQSPEYTNQRWQLLRACLSLPGASEGQVDDAYSMTQMLTFNTALPISIVSCIDSARENARQVREQISSEIWEHVNRLYLEIKRTTIEEMWYTEPHAFLTSVKEGAQFIQGLTDATMNHSEGWHFIRLGRAIERSVATATLLDVYTRAFLHANAANPSDAQGHTQYLSWVGLLRSCAAFEAYCKVYTANIQPAHIIEFLLFNAESPRAIRFSAVMIQNALQSIARATNTRTNKVERIAGRLCSMLEYDQIEEAMYDMHAYLENIQRQYAQIHNVIGQTYVSYPIDAALIARGTA
ncbi:MAG TPA: alpha-E domain-containing protein [Ktedonobacteraceae bacterium]|jgi:uncharacterized alpha-E superfamily protein